MPNATKGPLKIFLCHASADKPVVRKLYRYLRSKGMDPWLDAEKLLPGENWEVEIPKALFLSGSNTPPLRGVIGLPHESSDPKKS